MIDQQTGGLAISETIQIKPSDSLEHIMTLNLGEVQELRDMHNSWRWLTLKNVKLRQDYFIISFGFYTNTLRQIDLVISEDKFDLNASWDTWSEAKELKRLTKLRGWLKEEVGCVKVFGWGSADASYDRRSGTSSIVLKYE